MRIVFWGTYDLGKPRNRILLTGLRERGIEVLECHADIWHGLEDKSQIRGWRGWFKQAVAALGSYPMLLWRYMRLPRHDWVVVGYPGIPDIFLIRGLAWLRRTPVALNWFLSAYDTVVLDRRLVSKGHPLAKALWLLEWLAIRCTDRVFMDTASHARRMEELFGLPHGCCGSVWVGAETTAFFPSAVSSSRTSGRPTRVLFYGQFIPLHGAATIVEAAYQLANEPFEWVLIGQGQDAPALRADLERRPLPKLRWLDWVDYPQLLDWIERSDVCLGIFGESDKAASVIPNKAYQVLAVGRPLITRDSEAIRELTGDSDDFPCLQRISPGDASALSHALLRFRNADMLASCHCDVASRITPASISGQLLACLSPDPTP